MYVKGFIRIKCIINISFSLWSKTQIDIVVKCDLEV